ncbi:ABC transporter permease [Aquihabitans daechungensis]|uniref:ABC transporter permease n=1 Tax=Aquihabitans daechungensis TaxID=1052257 RepID=UPI003B9F2426
MDDFLTFTLIGLVTGALYAIAASGLVVTYTTSGIFNFAHGATGMFAAFLYWKLRVDLGWPAPVALIVILFVIAPLFGAVVERVIIRGLWNVSEVTKLIVSISLLFGVYSAATIMFSPNIGRQLPGFFEGNTIDLGVYDMSWHEAITILAAVLTAAALRFLLFGTRSGVAMRAVVDDRDLSRLNGGRPDRSAMLSWAIGSSLAALAGILLAGSQGALTHIPLTLLVINAYGAAMFGRLRSLPLTFLGAAFIGLAESFAIGYLDLDTPLSSFFGTELVTPLSLNGIRAAIPVLILFTVLLFLPPLKVRAGAQLKSREIIPSPGPRRWLIGTVVLGAAAFAFASLYEGVRTFQMGQGLALGIVMLSLVPLIGYAGQISLAPMAFAGIGALVMGGWGGEGTLFGLVAAVVVTAAAGALVALPAIRLRGLYLALATAAFAVLMDQLVFNQNAVMPNGSLAVGRLDLFGFSFDDDRAHLVLIGVTFGLVATLIVWMRNRPFGRRLLAMKSSDAACVTLGVNLATTKLQVFTLSAGIAGLGGALYGAQLNSVSTPTFQFLNGLPIVLFAVIGGIAAVGGALFGGILYALSFLILPEVAPALTNLLVLGPALAGISLGRNPNGAVNETARSFKRMLDERAAAKRTSETGAPAADDLDLLGVDGFSDADRVELDRETGLDAEPLYGPLRPPSRPAEVLAHG